MNSTTGFVLGVILGLVAGVFVVIASGVLAISATGPDPRLFLFASACAGAILGYATLGWRQSLALQPYVPEAGRWTVAMAFAWIPILVAYLGYEAILRQMVIAIYPAPHAVTKLLATEVALLYPSLVAFAVIIRRLRTHEAVPLQHRKLPRTIIGGLLLPPLLVALAFGVLWVGQSLRVERAWIADSYSDYLSVDAHGNVVTSPPASANWGPDRNLLDHSPDNSTLAKVVEQRVVLYRATGGGTSGGSDTPIRTIQVFSGPPPENYYADDAVNIVRFSPDSDLIAVGTGNAIEGDSFVNPSYDHAVHIWSLADSKLHYKLSEPEYIVRALAWSPDGHYLAAAGGLENLYSQSKGDNILHVWHLDRERGEGNLNPTLSFDFKGHNSAIEALAWSTDGSKLVSRDQGGTVVIWRIR